MDSNSDRLHIEYTLSICKREKVSKKKIENICEVYTKQELEFIKNMLENDDKIIKESKKYILDQTNRVLEQYS